MRKVAYFFLIVFFAVSAFAIFAIGMTLFQTQRAVQPVGELVKQLVVPATPVILPDSVTIVREINDLARLETASYSMEKIIRAERNQDVLWGALGETLIFVAYGEVIAGVDLAKMQPDDLQVVGPDTVQIYLPDAEIFVVNLDNERSHVADRDTGLLTRADPQLETQVRQEAVNVLREEALEAGALATADENARAYIRQFLNSLGFGNVTFTDAPPPPAGPYEQDVPKGYTLTPVP